jgi:hypothetical protein
MRDTKHLPILFAALCAVAVTALVYFARSAAVESTPAYSTLNTSRNGAKLLFDGLNDARIVQVSRQFKSVGLEHPHHATVFYLGLDPFDLLFADAELMDLWEDTAAAGNQVVIAVTDRGMAEYADMIYADTSKGPRQLVDRWGVRFVANKATPTSSIAADKHWTALTDYGPQVYRRRFGGGGIVLVGQGQRLTNKGVATDGANRQLLADLVSAHASAVFEEAHLGIRESGSIVGLARHYHLQGLLFGFVLLAGLFVWSRSVPFPPAAPQLEKPLAGSDTRSMLAELMSRHLKGQLLITCVTEWNRTRLHADALAVPPETNVVQAYASLQKDTQEKTTFRL